MSYNIKDILTIHRAKVVNYQGLSLQTNAGTQIQVRNTQNPITHQRVLSFSQTYQIAFQRLAVQLTRKPTIYGTRFKLDNAPQLLTPAATSKTKTSRFQNVGTIMIHSTKPKRLTKSPLLVCTLK